MLGKKELLAKGHFDDIDMAMMIHTGSSSAGQQRSAIAQSSNGALVKQIRFVGRAAHAGGAAGQLLAHLARTAFVSGMDLGLLTAALVAAVGALLALAWLPGRR